MEIINHFTFIPTWIIQDAVILLMAFIGVFFIIKNEKQPISILLEFFCFVFFYASVYENFATMMGWYGYGRSLIMIFNVPLTVPIIEYLVVYTAIRLSGYMKMPGWSKPFFVGFMGMLFDFTLDPLAIKQIFNTSEGTIGRWTWFINPNDVNILGEPVYNFTGWVLLCGYATIFILLGRWWYSKAKHKEIIGFIYPFLSMIAALLIMVSPLSRLLLWLGPFSYKGTYMEWIMLVFWFVTPLTLLIIYGRKFKKPLHFGKEYLIFLVYTGSYLCSLIFILIGNHFKVLPIVLGFILFQSLLIFTIYFRSRRLVNK
jgi:hypothetical protein